MIPVTDVESATPAIEGGGKTSPATFTIFGLPCTNAKIWRRDLCWADSPRGDIYGECQAGTVREGLCRKHFIAIFGRAP